MRQVETLRNKIKKYVEVQKKPRKGDSDYRKTLATYARLLELDEELAALSEREEYDEFVEAKVKNIASKIDSLISS